MLWPSVIPTRDQISLIGKLTNGISRWPITAIHHDAGGKARRTDASGSGAALRQDILELANSELNPKFIRGRLSATHDCILTVIRPTSH
jgi:hypothetical protein